MYLRQTKSYDILRDRHAAKNGEITKECYDTAFRFFDKLLTENPKKDHYLALSIEILKKNYSDFTEEYLAGIVYTSVNILIDHVSYTTDLLKEKIINRIGLPAIESNSKKIIIQWKGLLLIPTIFDYLSLLIDKYPLLKKYAVDLKRLAKCVISNPSSQNLNQRFSAVDLVYYFLDLKGIEKEFTEQKQDLANLNNIHRYIVTSDWKNVKNHLGENLWKLVISYISDDQIIMEQLIHTISSDYVLLQESEKKALSPRINQENFVKSRVKVGEGVSGKVYKYRQDGKEVAVKIMQSFEGLTHEAVVMSSLKHKNIQSASKIILEDNLAGIQMTLQTTTLNEQLVKDKIDNIVRRKWVLQLLNGMDYLHRNGIIHGDLKPQNILISKSGVIKIADFGLTNLFCLPGKQRLGVNYITANYRPPELFNSEVSELEFSFEVDVWSFGVIICEIILKRFLVVGGSEEKIYSHIKKNFIDSYINPIPNAEKDLQTIVRKSLSSNPNLRATSAELLTYFQ